MDIEGMKDPRFLEWVMALYPGPLEPDPCDLEVSRRRAGGAEGGALDAYCLAQASKLVRLHRQWKASWA